MFKLFCLALVIFVLNGETSGVSVFQNDKTIFEYKPWLKSYDTRVDFSSHMADFVALIDLEKVMGVVVKYIYDIEVLEFLGFLLSPDLNTMILEFESISEFREAFAYLTAKGYDMHSLINAVNAALNLPPFEMRKLTPKMGKGINGLIKDLIAALPMDEMKALFERKLQTSPEVAQLFVTVNSEEFLGILRRMSQNPKFLAFKTIFESYGFDFKYICQLAMGILGDYYQGVFCM